MGCWLSSWRMLRRLGLQAVQVLRTADIPIFNGTVVAETEDYEVVEGNVYFQPESIKQEYFSDSGLNTPCPWKGLASYYSVSVDGQEARDVTWRGMVLPGAFGRCKQHQSPRGVLSAGGYRRLKVRLAGCCS